MKKIVILLIISIMLDKFALAGDLPLTDHYWAEKTYEEVIFTPLYQDAFVSLYNFTEENTDNLKVFKAFRLMSDIHNMNRIDYFYKNKRNFLKSEELIKVLDKIYSKGKNPETAKDYFYSGLFAYESEDTPDGLIEPMFFFDARGPFEYIIDNYSDTIFAEYSYYFLARNDLNTNKKDKTIDLFNKYLTKSGEKGVLIADFYDLLFNMYSGLKYSGVNENSPEYKEKLDFKFKYANKLLTEFPERKDLISGVYEGLGNYYLSIEDYDKALEYYYKICDDADFRISHVLNSIRNITRIHKKRKEYNKIDDLLENIRKKERFFNDKRTRALYKDFNRKIEEIKRFGYDEENYGHYYEKVKNENKKPGEPDTVMIEKNIIPEKKKEAVLKFRAEYEKCFDKDYNLVKPIKSIKIGVPKEE